MKKLIILIILTLTCFTYAQNKVELRYLTFSIPNEFIHFTEQDRKLDYSAFHEVGKVFTDSTNLGKFPKIQYQYFEVPGFGMDSSKNVLTRLNETMTKDIPADTLIIKAQENYSLAKYTILGNSLFEIKSLGKNGWINIQYFDIPNNDPKNYAIVATIINSIVHKEVYFSEYQNHIQEGAEHSKRAFIFLAIGLLFFIVTKWIKKL